LRLRPDEEHRILHVVSNLTRQPGLRRRVIDVMDVQSIRRAATEIRTCGWLAQVDEHGGSIFHWRPHSRGASDMTLLVGEVLQALGEQPQPENQANAVLSPEERPPLLLAAPATNEQQHDAIT
jgi:hypothetical protein